MTEPSSETRLFTIGHSNHPLEVFLGLLQLHGVTAIADVRSLPSSRFHYYNRDPLIAALKSMSIQYVFLGTELGARRTEHECYEDGKASYHLIARTGLFQHGLERIQRGLESFKIALLCAEKDPLTCHRAILVCRHLRGKVGPIGHILSDGLLEYHTEAETRLVSLCGLARPDLFHSREELIEMAYDVQGGRIAYTGTPTSSEDAHE